MRHFLIKIFFILALSSFNSIFAQQEVRDIDGNLYKVVSIDQMLWIAQNLNVSHYLNGDSIPEAKSEDDWVRYNNLKIGCWSSNENITNKYRSKDSVSYAEFEPGTFGKLYNWYAINDPRGLGIKDFHIPLLNEWEKLVQYGTKNLISKTGWLILSNAIYAGCNCIGYSLNGSDIFAMNIKAPGYRNLFGIWDDYGSYYEEGVRAVFWASDSKNKFLKSDTIINNKKIQIEEGASSFGVSGWSNDEFWIHDGTSIKGSGYSIRLLKNK